MAESLFETMHALEKENKALWSEVSAHTKRLDTQLEMISAMKDTISSLRKRIADIEEKHEEDDF